ncbi:n-terminal acetyltransferase a complex auxiliary subunit naa15 [Quercus suber]|uniref:N-terminal acetyltransferase a complex auxiliary subunit naa15 n=1 Tax=Quercus suber TaxID=58331 RepID=A0AAW0LUL1_QUESU
MGASLPPKEANLFKLIVGLTLNCMDRKTEAYELVRQGLKNDLKSHVCWHVYGLLYRSDREYREAIKCYRNALRIDPENIEILRDLSLLQAQMRDLAGFVETRQKLLSLKPNHRMNWIGFSVAHHLNSNASKAVEILEAYEGTLEDDYPPDNEQECGFLERALEELHKKEFKIVDKLVYKEQEVSLLVKLGRLEEAEKLYQALLSMNPDNYRYYEGLQKCVGLYSENDQFSADEIDQLEALYKSLGQQQKYYEGLQKCVGLYSENDQFSADEIDQLEALYKSLGQQQKWSSAVKRIPLDFLQGNRFREAAENYIRPLLTKGVPSLFSDLSPLYDHPGKADILEQLILELEHSLRTTGQYPGRTEKEPPSTLMWALFLLAQHYDRRGQYDISLSKIDEAIEHTPTVIDLYSVKSRILKHAGDLAAAAALADEARCMDLADRYINSDCVKRMLQADQVALAEKTAVLFTKEGEQHNNLHDMQCMYELASGESYFRQGDLGRALKKFLSVEKHYADITEDQFDFHSYCLRKMTLRTYVEMLRFQDHEDDEMSKLPPSQKKKMRQKQRKAEARAKKEAEEKHEESSVGAASKSGKRHVKPVDPDPNGEKLLQVEDPLLEATKYLKLLQKNSPNSLETHLLSFELNMRKQRILLAFQALKQLLRLDAEHPDSHRSLIKFFHKVGSMAAPVTDTEKLIWSVLEAERPTISQLHEKSLIEGNRTFLEQHKGHSQPLPNVQYENLNICSIVMTPPHPTLLFFFLLADSLMHRAAVAEMLYVLEPDKKPEAIKLIEESTNNIVPKNGALGPVREWKLKDCIAVHKFLGTVLVDNEAALRWKVRCAEYFPFSTYFEGSLSSAVPNSAYNRICKRSENGSANHSGGETGDSLASNGKLETFKDLTI